MMRARILKPGFFDNEILGQLSADTRLCFAGLWGLADREGRLEDRPERIREQLFPYNPGMDLSALLDTLHVNGFIVRYQVADTSCIQVLKFTVHQHPHKHEPASKLPALPENVATRRDMPRHVV